MCIRDSFLTAYPEAKKVLDYEALQLRKFKSGALIRFAGEFCRVSDVMKHPGDLPGNLFSEAASLADKLKIASLRSQVGRLSISEIAGSENITTRERLEQFGFSPKIIGSFFRPFFGGVFLEGELNTSRRMFDFVFKMFAEGDVVVPELGMGEISTQLASMLPANSIETNCRVIRVDNDQVEIEGGQVLSAKQIIMATDQKSASQLSGTQDSDGNGVTCLYFSADKSPTNEPILVLNGDETDSPINNLCVLSDVSSAYAPESKSLVSITVLGSEHGEDLTNRVIEQARDWYGSQVDDWEHIKTYQIPFALPRQGLSELTQVAKALTSESGTIRCGDHLNFASIQGAMQTGRLAAEAVS